MEPSEGFIEVNTLTGGGQVGNLTPRQEDRRPLRLHYLRWQLPTEHSSLPPLLMLHATGFLARLWQPVAERLTDRYTVWAYDARGHGDSDKPDGDYHWQRLVDDLEAVMDNFALRGIPCVGHSSGGAAAVYLASQRPEYFSKLVLIEPIIMPGAYSPSDDQRNSMAEGARRRRMVWPSREELIDTYRERSTFSRWTDDCLRLYAEHGAFQREDGQFELKCPGDVEAQFYANSASLPIWDALPQVACPTLVLRGEHSEGMITMIAEQASQRVPDGRLATVPGAGHLAPMERPEAVAEMIEMFLEQNNG